MATVLSDSSAPLTSADQMLECLGKPNYMKQLTDKEVCIYFTESGMQCSGAITLAGYDTLEVASLVVLLSNKKVLSVGQNVP
jgi:hypothetical protein